MTPPETKPVASKAQFEANKLAAMRALEAAGFPLIPVCSPEAHQHSGKLCTSPGKSPTVAGWVAAKPGQFAPEDLNGNYGVVLGPRDLVIDIDPRNFKPGDKPVSRLFADLKISAPKSFTVKSGGGGLHIYLAIPEGFVCVNDLKAYPGVEFKSAGRQVVGPGSIHAASQKIYSIASGSPDIRAEAPPELLALIKAPEKSDLETKPGTGKYIDDSATQERFASHLETAAPSIQGQNGDLTAFKTAAHGRDLGLSPKVCLDIMLALWNPKCQPPWDASELQSKVEHAYKYASGEVGASHPASDFTPIPKPPVSDQDIKWNMKGSFVVKDFMNLLNYLKAPAKGLAQVFGFNEFTARVEFARPAPWHKGIMPRHRTVNDNDLKLLKGYLAVECKFEMPVGSIEEAVCIVANENKFHPIREYLNSLTWDKTPRLDKWLHDYCGAADDDYTRAVSRKVLVAAVMRVFKPGCQFDHALVLEGDQGIGKSSVCRILGGEFSGDFAIDPHSKDTIQLMQGKWIIELAELEVARRSDSDALKAFISRQVDTARLAYGRLASEFPRQSILVATKNPGADGTYLKDDTGNRRWWPVALKPKSGMIDFRGLKDARNQLFAEAMHYAQKGERLDMDTNELKSAAKAIVKERHADHAWTERIGTWLDALPADREFLTAREIFIDAMGGVDKQLDARAYSAIAGVMKTLGWKGLVKRVGTRTTRGYQRPPVVLELPS